MTRRNRIGAAAGIAALGLAVVAAFVAGERDMQMTAVEKYFVNRPSHAASVARHAQQLLDRVPAEPGWKYLEAGCGVGAAAREIALARRLEVTGVDIDPAQIEAARAGGVRAGLQFHTMDVTRLNFSDAAFDIVATSKVTHHIPQWEKAFAEMARVVRPGGYLIYTDFVMPGWLARLGARLAPVAGYPSLDRLAALAAERGLSEVYRAGGIAQVDLIWRKNGS